MLNKIDKFRKRQEKEAIHKLENGYNMSKNSIKSPILKYFNNTRNASPYN
tara:strand:+ start:454 stop:603 length:150 start_codon:yes stop_codon:yes gene_type:complete